MTRVLVVDDKADNLYYLEMLLSGNGYEVQTARHGAEALVKARQSPPTLIVSDLLMPVMDGYTLLRHWKSDRQLRTVPFVVYTATYTAPEDEKLALSLGADAFIVKPMEPEDFIRSIRQVLANPLKAPPKVPASPAGDDDDLVKEYSEALVRKLEEKTLLLETSNLALEMEVAERRKLAQTQNAILDALPAHIALLDGDGIIVAVNEPWRQFARENGLENPDLALGSNYLKGCDEITGACREDALAIVDGVRGVLVEDAPDFSMEYPCHTQTRLLWFRAMVSPVLVEKSRGALVTHINVTDRALADITLRQSEQELQTLARELGKERERLVTAQTVAKIGSWETTLETLEVVWSEETYRIFELDPAQFRPAHATFLAFVHPEDRATVENAFQDSMPTRDIRTVDHRILMFDGRVKFVTETWQTFMDDKGRPARAVGTCQDITEREVVNDLLRSSEARLRRSQEISSVAERVASIGSVALDLHTDRWEWSDQAYRIYGVMRETFTPSPETLGELVHPEDVEILLASISLAREGTTSPPLEYRIRRPDGAERVLRRETTLVRGYENTVIGIVGTVQDVTDIRAAERERDLLQTQLRQSQRLEAIGQMTGGVAHDFNNLLTVILGNAESFERHLAKDTPLHELAQMTRMAAERGAELTSRLLAFSRRQPLAPKAADINSLVLGMDKLLCRALGEQISITTICGDGLWRALIDTSQLESAVLNLSVNARDAMPEGGSLTIETKNVHLDQTYVVDQAHGAPGNPDIVPGQYVMIAVTDTGIGMNEETRLQAFDPFFTTKDVGKGSGLGLSMVYGFVRQSKGHVRIYSEPGHGTTIKLYLPRADDDADASEVPIVEISAPGGTESILLVEDDDLVRSQVTMQLKDLGYQVTSAIDGVEALDILRTTSDFHLLFTDLVMPRGLNGRELADEARKLRPELPVLFTSGYADNALVHHGRVDSGVNLLSKPYRRLDLATKIRALLDHAGDKVV